MGNRNDFILLTDLSSLIPFSFSYRMSSSMPKRWKQDDLRPIIDDADFVDNTEPLTLPVTSESLSLLPTNFAVSILRNVKKSSTFRNCSQSLNLNKVHCRYLNLRYRINGTLF